MSRINLEQLEEVRRIVRAMPGRKLPGERELSDQLKISRPYVRAILAKLEAEGAIARRQGSGTYAVDTRAGLIRQVALLLDSDLKLGEDPFFSQLLERVQRALQDQGIRCTVLRVDGQNPITEPADAWVTFGQAAEGILNLASPTDPPILALFLHTSVEAKHRTSIFEGDDVRGGMMAAERLLSKDCSQLIFVGRHRLPAFRDRLAGVMTVAEKSHIPLQVISCSLNYAAGRDTGLALELPTDGQKIGIVAANDWLAVGLNAGLASRPDSLLNRIEIVSFDGLSIAAAPFLRIDSLAIPLDTIASDAVDELKRLCGAPFTPGRVVRYAPVWRV